MKEVEPDIIKAREALGLATHYLERAEGNLKIGYSDVSLICAYNAMLHSARALLFRDGIKERSHACVGIYLREKYSDPNKIPEKYVNLFDLTRKARHKTQYGGRIEVPENEAADAIREAREFHSLVVKIIGEQK
ncbi:MAG: HEPN domain-containing protein [Candidatus Thermoplasmatota archaeon]